jgi:iron complex transport system substrate-binding protein
MPCGFDAERAVKESQTLASHPAWGRLRAVRAGRAYAVDGNAYFSRPGPRVVDGIELLASILHSERAVAPKGARAITLPVSSSVA